MWWAAALLVDHVHIDGNVSEFEESLVVALFSFCCCLVKERKIKVVKEKVEALKAKSSPESSNGGMVVVFTGSCCPSCGGSASFQDEKQER